MIRAHQPGAVPIDIPEAIPNPVIVPEPNPAPKEPAPREPVKVPEKVPTDGARPVVVSLPLEGISPAIETMKSGSVLKNA